METIQSRLSHFPVAFFATIMGLSGFSIAIARVETLYNLDSRVSMSLSMMTLLLFVVLLSIYIIKFIKYPQAVRNELHHPIQLSFFPTISISLILLSICILHHNAQIAHIFWIIGSSLQLGLTLFVMNRWINHDYFEIKHMNPAWFIPIVGNILVPVAGVQLGYTELSWFFFSIGLLFWPVLLTIIMYRVIFHPALPEKLIPTFFILIAPPAVGFISYLQLNTEVDNFARLLYFSALFFTLLIFTQVQRFAKLKFFLSWWAYSFPLAAMSIATMLMFEKTQGIFYSIAGIMLIAILTAFIAILIIRTATAIMDRKICVGE